MSTKSHKKKRSPQRITQRIDRIDEVCRKLPCVLLSIVFEYARPLIERSPVQKQRVQLCCISDDAKRLFVVVREPLCGFDTVHCVDMSTYNWQDIHTFHTGSQVLSGTMFRGILHLIFTREESDGVACLPLQCDRWEEYSYNNEQYILYDILPYNNKDVLIGTRSDGQLQHLDLDRKHHLVSRLHTSQFPPFNITAVMVNQRAAEIYMITHDFDENFRISTPRTEIPVLM